MVIIFLFKNKQCSLITGGNMKIQNLVMLLLCFIICCGTGINAQLTGKEIMTKVDNRADGDDQKSVLKMILINKRGRKRVREMLSFKKDYGKDSKKIMFFKSPADVKGTGFLSYDYENPQKDDERWLYLPAMKKTRRISGSSKNDYFMGTDFTYDDMGDRAVEEDIHKYIKDEKIRETDCWVVESVSKDKSYMYSKKISWIDKKTLIPVKVDYYDRDGDLLKTLNAFGIRKEQDFWTSSKIVMKNHLEKHETILEYKDRKFNTGIKESVFRVSTLERGRLK